MRKILFICVTVLMLSVFLSNQEAMAKSSKMKFDPYNDAVEFKHKEKEQKTKTTDGEVQLLGLCATKDSYEDNNSFNDAAKVPLSQSSIDYWYDYLYATIHKDAWICGNDIDKDYYLVDATREGQLVVKLYSIPTGVDYDVKVYDKSHNFIKGSYYGGNHDEEVTINVSPGQYYIYIYSYDGYNESDTYTLRTRIYRDTTYYDYIDVKDVYTAPTINSMSLIADPCGPDVCLDPGDGGGGTTTNYVGAIWKSEVNLPEILNNDYLDNHLVPHHQDIVMNKTIIWDGDTMREVVTELENYENELSSLRSKYSGARITLKISSGAAGVPSATKIVASVATGTAAGTVTVTAAGVAAVLLIADYALSVESDLLSDHIDVVQDLQANIEPLYNTQSIAIEIAIYYNLNDLHSSQYSSYWYSNYYIVSKVFNLNDYYIYEDFKDFTAQKTIDPDYYNAHYFAGEIELQTSSLPLSDNLHQMLELKKEYDKLNYINNWPFNWLD